jgi:ubiquinone/menaquinone biosynthesis C-methylase UbiE
MADYDKFAQGYRNKRKDKNKFDYNRDIEVPALIKIIGDVKGKTILDMGCGFGDHAKQLSKQKFKKLIGFDISKELVKFANEQKIPNSEFYVGDMGKKLIHKNYSFDVVFAGLSIHYVKNQNKLFKEVNRVLKKRGIFCFQWDILFLIY